MIKFKEVDSIMLFCDLGRRVLYLADGNEYPDTRYAQFDGTLVEKMRFRNQAEKISALVYGLVAMALYRNGDISITEVFGEARKVYRQPKEVRKILRRHFGGDNFPAEVDVRANMNQLLHQWDHSLLIWELQGYAGTG